MISITRPLLSLHSSSLIHKNVGVKVCHLGDLVGMAEEAMDCTTTTSIESYSKKLMDHLVQLMHLSCQYSKKYILIYIYKTYIGAKSRQCVTAEHTHVARTLIWPIIDDN